MKDILVIHHSADFDGIFCREIARKFFGDAAEYVGWDYGQPKIPYSPDRTIYVLDLSPECLDGLPENQSDWKGIVWIDHHKSAIEKFFPGIAGYRIDGVAACRLAWQWFHEQPFVHGAPAPKLPEKQAFVDRDVREPYAVRLAGEYDIWDKRNPDAEVFQLGLRSKKLTDADWVELLDPTPLTVVPGVVSFLLINGRLIQDYVNQRDAAIVGALGFIVEFEGLKFLALNSSTKGSLQFAAKDVPETGHDALLKFNYTGSLWDVSLYHAKHRTDLDLSQIAVKFGGGGHRGACGFRVKELPFIATLREPAEALLAAIEEGCSSEGDFVAGLAADLRAALSR